MKRFFLLALLALTVSASTAFGDDAVDSVLDNLEWRNIGPAIMGGRINDFAVVESNPKVAFVATASAGIWKTTNNGITWESLFDDQPVSSVGDVAVAPSDPSIVWAGTGEPANRQSSSWGDGVYKSMDGGATWTNMGLEDTHHIGRVRIHPTNPNIVYVAALGHLWGPNEQRGVFKTTDGGKTWKNTKFISENTGFVDLAMDPESPDTLYAAAYQRRRRAFGFNGGGPESGLYKTTDGATTWTKLAKGLPEGDTGRIGIDIYRKDARIVYAIVQNAEGGIFRSEDKGETWEKMSDTNPRPMYYSQIRIDPLNERRIWVLGGPMYNSDDGGRTFVTDRVTRIHGDHHALWINPRDSNDVLLGSDGGIHYSYDRGLTWDFVNSLALGQFYEIGYDMETPYNIYGGLQDNGSWGGPVRTRHQQGISNEDWFSVGGDDGFYTQVDPNDATTIYVESQNGVLRRLDTRSLETKTIRPEPGEGENRYRFDWNSPVAISPHDSKTIYYGGNRLFKSTNRGDEWTRTVDLSKNRDRDELPIMGVMLNDDTLSRNDGISTYGQITTISESPLVQGLLYVGTDDGNVQVSRDGGESWNNVAANLPGGHGETYVTRVVSSQHAEGRVYATLDGHRNDDFATYAFASDDYGETWRRFTTGIPEGHTLNVIREHPDNGALLFAGGERGVYVSFDGGDLWHEMRGSFPRVPVDDIAIHPRDNDLILGTHGRSIWVLDDMKPLENLSDAVLAAKLHVFPIRDAVNYRLFHYKTNPGHKVFLAKNPPQGALIYYYLSEPEAVKVTVSDATGQVVRTIEGSNHIGLNRTNWDLRYDGAIRVEPTEGSNNPPPRLKASRQNGNIEAMNRLRPRVFPGTYTVRVEAGSESAERTVIVTDDPNVRASDADRRAHLDALLELRRLISEMYEAHEQAAGLTEQLDGLEATLHDTPETVATAFSAAKTSASEIERLLSHDEGRTRFGSATRPLRQRLMRLYRALDPYTEAPSAQRQAQIASMSRELNERLDGLKAVVSGEIAELNRAIEANRVPRIRPPIPRTPSS